jgi:hypothetical protein
MPILIKGAAQVMQTEQSQAHARMVQGWFGESRTVKRRPQPRPPFNFIIPDQRSRSRTM